MAYFSILRFVAVVLAVLLGLAGIGRADARNETARLGLVVFGDELPGEAVRAALERELGRTVVLLQSREGGAIVTISLRRQELAVSYDEPNRGSVSRVVAARRTADENVQDAVVLAASLVRNEVDELLGKAPAPAPTPTTAPGSAPAARAAPMTRVDDYVPAYVSLFHPAASNALHPYARTHFGFGLLYGRAGELDNGVQLGTVNVITSGGGVASGAMSGVQLAPLFGLNYASGLAAGMQVGMLANIAGGGLEGGQIAFVGNVAGEGVDGAQLAFGANIATGRVRGAQLGAVNVAGDVRGTQLGLINVGRKIEGLTIGLINVADDVDGVPIGIVSVTRTGGVHPLLWGGSAGNANFGLKFATKYTYTMIAAHYAVVSGRTFGAPPVTTDSRDFVGGGFFIGAHVPAGKAFADVDLGLSAYLSPGRSTQARDVGGTIAYHEGVYEPRLRLIGGYSFFDHFSLFAGIAGVVRVRIVNSGADAVVTALPDVFGGVQF